MYLRDEYIKKIENSRIDIYGLICYIVKKWKNILLLSAIIFVLVALVIIPRYNKKNAVQNSNVAENLSEEEQLRVDSALRLYSELEEMDDYKRKSLYMNINAYECYIGTLQYRISEKNISIYESFVKDGGLKKILEDQFGAEIVRPSDLVTVTGSNILTLGNSSIEERNDEGNLCVKITTDNEELTERMMLAVKDAIIEYQNKLEEFLGSHVLILLSEEIYVGVDEDVKVGQSNFEVELDRKRTHIFNLENKLSSTEKAALNSIKNNEDVVVTTEQKSRSIPLVLFVALIFLSIAFSCLLVACYYILNNKIKSGKDIVTFFDIPYLGEISKISKKTELDIIGTELEFIAYEKNLNVFFFGFAGGMKNVGDYIEALKASLTERKLKCVFGENIEKDVESMRSVKDCQNIIIVFGINKTSYDSIDVLIQKCVNWKVNVLGAIGVKDL